MSSSATPDFGKRAAVYDELRPADDNWWELYELLVREGELEGRRVLDVGCGTGRFSAALAERAKVWGLDPSPEMLEVARGRVPPGVGLRLGSAEKLPFRDGSFEAAVLWLVVHLVDRSRAFPELCRVLRPGGRLLIATFDPSHFNSFWLNRLFSSLEAIDRARFPTPEALEAELGAAGFGKVRFVRLSQRATLGREAALERIRGKHISTFDLLGDDEYESGLARAEVELSATVDYALEWIVTVAER
jgi:SAM-dependent methyltransferase